LRKLALAAFLAVALAAPGRAADLGDGPIGALPAPAAPGHSWTGCYVGGTAGGLWSEQSWLNRTPGGAFFNQSLGGHDADGFIGGVQAGCDYQFARGLLIGVEGDYGWTDAPGSHPSAREVGVTYHGGIDGLGSVTGRIGYGWDRLLFYAKAGGAWQGDEYRATTLILGTAYAQSVTRSGWTIGGGGEYALTRHLSAFVEYNHYDFGDPVIGLTPQVAGLPRAFVKLEETSNVVRAGINLRFGGF
jgi:outer membrane immunogenic protein